MRALLFLAAAIPPLAACDIEKTGKDDKSVTFNAADNGAVAFQVPGVKGSIRLPSAMMTSSDMDIDGVKLFPGSRISDVRAVDHDVTIRFKSPATVATVRDYYAKAFADKGVTVTASGNSFTGKTGDGDDFSLNIADSEGAAAGTMKIDARK